MKFFMVLFTFSMVLGFQSLQAQTFTSNAPKTTERVAKKNDVRYIATRQFDQGRNYVRLGNTRLEVIKRERKIISVRPINRAGKKGPNILSDPNGGSSEFWCIGGICGCTGDDDCNDMCTSDVCGDKAVCVGDNCYCGRD